MNILHSNRFTVITVVNYCKEKLAEEKKGLSPEFSVSLMLILLQLRNIDTMNNDGTPQSTEKSIDFLILLLEHVVSK